jgi:hypothetical protein
MGDSGHLDPSSIQEVETGRRFLGAINDLSFLIYRYGGMRNVIEHTCS